MIGKGSEKKFSFAGGNISLDSLSNAKTASYSEGVARIHFVGIGGVGINALAKFANDVGIEASGSDAKLCPLATSVGGNVYCGVNADAVDGADLVAYTEAAKPSHPEIMRARELFIPTVPRQKLLGEVSALFDRSVAVAGTHGKTTTCAMLAHILKAADKKFVAMIGGESLDFSNYVNNRLEFSPSEEEKIGFLAHCAGKDGGGYSLLRSRTLSSGGIFVTEACEYKRSFLELKPYIGVVTNVEYDHPDCYSSLEDVRRVFDEFLAQSRVGITAVDKKSKNAFAVRAMGNGLDVELSLESGVVKLNGKAICKLTLPLGGEYNLGNAMFALAAAYALGINVADGAAALTSFAGVKRRFERAKDVDGVTVYFDFAHHPTEIACALKRARETGRTLAVFQPHTYSRTAAYLEDFVEALGAGDEDLVLLPTYAARESKEEGLDSDALADAVKARFPKKRVILAGGKREALDAIGRLAKGYDVILMLGAGDIYDLKDML